MSRNQRVSSRSRWKATWMVGSLVMLVALASCQKKTEQAATPPADMAAGGMGGAGAAKPIDLHWDSTNNCVSYTPAADTLKLGGTVNFNSSVPQSVTVYAPAGCFSANPDTFVVPQGGPGPIKTGYSAGSYQLTFSPGACASVSGGNGPSVIINTGGN